MKMNLLSVPEECLDLVKTMLRIGSNNAWILVSQCLSKKQFLHGFLEDEVGGGYGEEHVFCSKIGAKWRKICSIWIAK